jgi:hypothetical protein
VSKEDQRNKERAVSQALPPAVGVRWAAYGELKIYPVDERTLEDLAQGSSESLYLNFAISYCQPPALF